MFGTWVSAVLAFCFRFDSVINNIVYLGQFNTAIVNRGGGLETH
jgi:hypothetical protein